MKKSKTKCYACDRRANTTEHVPPRCLFPESKDVNGKDYRKNLITVPSCDEHNSKKSKDDEFLMVSIGRIIWNNELGCHHSETKIARTIKTKHDNFLEKEILRNLKNLLIKTENESNLLISIGNPNYQRLIKCFENIAYGLYFNEFSNSFKGEIKMFLEFLYLSQDDEKLKSFIKKAFELDERGLNIKGDNPDVFKYQFYNPDEFGLIALKLIFYGTSEVYISFIPEDKKESFSQLRDIGSINITVGNETFEFNKNKK